MAENLDVFDFQLIGEAAHRECRLGFADKQPGGNRNGLCRNASGGTTASPFVHVECPPTKQGAPAPRLFSRLSWPAGEGERTNCTRVKSRERVMELENRVTLRCHHSDASARSGAHTPGLARVSQ